MRLARATFLGIHGVPDTTCDLMGAGGRPHDLVVVTGEPQSGKTRLLEAILTAKDVIAPYEASPEEGDVWIRAGLETAKVELTFALDREEQRRFGLEPLVDAEALFEIESVGCEADEGLRALLSDYAHDGRTAKVEYFPATRGLASYVSSAISAGEQAPLRTSNRPAKYAFVPAYLASLARSDAAASRFSAILSALAPGLAYGRPASGDPTRCILAGERGPVSPHELSSTEADAVLFAATASLIHLDRSIVFIDRPELSADEATIAAHLGRLRALGEDVQIIVASTSPAVLRAADPSAIIKLSGK